MTYEMSQAVAGIKGTTFVLEETGTESTLKVIEGLVEFTSKKTGAVEMIGAGEAITATKEGLKEKITFDVEKEIEDWEEMKDGNFENVQKEDEEDDLFGIFLGILLMALTSVGYFLMKKRQNKTIEDDLVVVENDSEEQS